MRRLTVQLAMLVMAIFLLAACGKSGHASAPQTAESRRPSANGVAGVRIVDTSPTGATSSRLGARATTGNSVSFAVIGDMGTGATGEKKVARMVNDWSPDFIIDLGDAYYDSAGGSTTDKYDRSIGTYYCDYLNDVTTTGTVCPHGNAGRNEFFPTLGNHDYTDAGLENYLEYFDLPGSGFTNSSGNERYYDFTWGPIHFFSLNSNIMEPDGVTPDSKQGQWLKSQLANSTSPWNIVFFHHPPYSSGVQHGSDKTMQWPFKEWGAQAVLSGHEHLYERLLIDGIAYFVNGAGGGPRYAFKDQPVPGSQVRIAGSWGAQKVTATDKTITFEFYTVDGTLADSYTMEK